MTARSRLIACTAGLAVLVVPSCWQATALAKPHGTGGASVQLLADVTLIDGACSGVTVRFGPAFRMAAGQGLDVADVMPGGPLRPAFEAAMLRRTAATSREELCGSLATAYATAMPTVVSQP